MQRDQSGRPHPGNLLIPGPTALYHFLQWIPLVVKDFTPTIARTAQERLEELLEMPPRDYMRELLGTLATRDKKRFLPLVEAWDYIILSLRVEELDSDAGSWMRSKEALDKARFPVTSLADAFAWDDSPQGFDFWENIHEQLGGEY